MKRAPLLVAEPSVSEFATVRADRDRFAALALCASDMLLELDSDLSIVFAGGETAACTGHDPRALIGKSALTLIASQDRPMMREALASAARGVQIRGLIVHLDAPQGQRAPFVVLGYHLADMDGHYFLSLRRDSFTLLLGESDPRRFVPAGDSGLPDARAFAALVGGRMHAHPAAENHRMTLIRLDGLPALWQRLDQAGRASLADAIGGSLRAHALQGEMAGQLDHECYALVHGQDVDLGAMTRNLVGISREMDPRGKGIAPLSASVVMDVADMGEPEQIKALLHTINKFTDHGPADFTIQNLSGAWSDMIGATIHSITEFRSIISEGNFEIAFQPIVDLEARRIHHYEALVRFGKFNGRFSTYEAITFAEQTGLICDFDLAMCAKVMRWLEDDETREGRRPLAVNLSGNSISSPGFVKALHGLLQQHADIRHLMMFEITESARIADLESVNAVVRGLRLAGHKVCLDDFGAGASAFHYLRALDVDVVKIDGVYVRDALKSDKGAAFLKAMAALCTDLGIEVVAEMVEEEASVAFLRQCGVTYGQGYLFGRPSSRIGDFDKLGMAKAAHRPPVLSAPRHAIGPQP